jgi:hypothetical protein
VRVDSSNPVVRDRVEAIARVVTEHGGFVHPELVIHHHQSSLWMSLPRSANPHYSAKTGLLDRPHATADPLLLVPDELHVPVSDLDWEPHDSVLRYRAETSHLTNAQQVSSTRWLTYSTPWTRCDRLGPTTQCWRPRKIPLFTTSSEQVGLLSRVIRKRGRQTPRQPHHYLWSDRGCAQPVPIQMRIKRTTSCR